MKPKDRKTAEVASGKKTAYNVPKLSVYGGFEQVTTGGGGGKGDGGPKTMV